MPPARGTVKRSVPDSIPNEETKRGRLKQETNPLSSYDDKIRPMLDVIDKLRNLGVESEGIPVPTIVVVGDQSSGKSSVLQALAEISLPKGSGIVTRVPLILRLKRATNLSDRPEKITIQYGEREKMVERELESEDMVAEAITEATDFLAGSRNGVTDNKIIITVERVNSPDLTLVDLPGITRVAIEGQPRDIYTQIHSMIHQHIKPEESVILNVLSAETDFSTSESIAMSQAVDPKGERTLAVVTKVDRCTDGVYEKVTANSVKIGLGYVCVWNPPELGMSYEEIRKKEARFFKKHPQLSTLPGYMLGIPSLASQLASIQSERIEQCLPKIHNQIKHLLSRREAELNSLPPSISSDIEAAAKFHQVVNIRRKKMESLFSGDYSGFPNEEFHLAAKLDVMFENTARIMRESASPFLSQDYHNKCIRAMERSKGISLPNMLSPTSFQELVNSEVDKLSPILESLLYTCTEYAQKVGSNLAKQCTDGYPKLERIFCTATTSAVAKALEKCKLFISRTIEKEHCVYTNNHYYMDTVYKIRKGVDETVHHAKNPPCPPPRNLPGPLHAPFPPSGTPPLPFGTILVNDLEPLSLTNLISNTDQAALDMQINTLAYWKVVVKRVGDMVPMEIKYTLKECLLEEIDNSVFSLTSVPLGDIMMEEPGLRRKRMQLEKSIEMLQESSKLVANL